MSVHNPYKTNEQYGNGSKENSTDVHLEVEVPVGARHESHLTTSNYLRRCIWTCKLALWSWGCYRRRKTRPTRRRGFPRVDHPNIRTSYWRSAAETFRRSHPSRVRRKMLRTRARRVPGQGRVNVPPTRPRRVHRFCGGWAEKKLIWILAISGHFLVFKVQPPQSGARASAGSEERLTRLLSGHASRSRSKHLPTHARVRCERRKVSAADLRCGVRIFG